MSVLACTSPMFILFDQYTNHRGFEQNHTCLCDLRAVTISSWVRTLAFVLSPPTPYIPVFERSHSRPDICPQILQSSPFPSSLLPQPSV